VCQACEAGVVEAEDVCSVCGEGDEDCTCRECVGCGRTVLYGDWDDDSELCNECHQMAYTACDGCDEDTPNEDVSPNGLCPSCEAERVEAMRDQLRELVEADDPAKVEAIHAALKAAGLL
jgi:hypothetical protein